MCQPLSPVTPDSDLLRRYLDARDEAAFAELVRRHLGLVYAATLRVVNGDTALAEDATQAAFTELARKAGSLTGRATLAGWLHTAARYNALRGIRSEQRRRNRELEATAMNDSTNSSVLDAAWEQMHPLLDEVLGRLRDRDRDAVLLRFFEEKSYREVGGILGISERAAQMRVERALDKLRVQFSRHGVTTTAALLITALGAHGAPAAPIALVASVAEKSLAGSIHGISPTLAGKKLLLASASGLAAVSIIIFLVLQSAKSTPTASAMPTKIVPTPVTPTKSPLIPTPMTPSQAMNTATLAAVMLATTPVAVAQVPPPPPPPPPSAPAAPLRNAAVGASQSGPPSLVPAEPGAYTALVAANNRFALDLFRAFDPQPNENAFFSPYSISTALAMTWTGARGNTATQLAKVLHFSDLTGDGVPASFSALQQAVTKAQTLSGAQLSIANSLWAEQNPEHPFLQSFLDGALTNFSALVTPVDFKNHAADAASQINNWVSEKTNDKIKNLIRPDDIDPSTRLALVNAIYFKGQWQYPFRPQQNANSEFHTAAGGTIPAVLMNQGMRTGYADITDGPVPLQVLTMSYGEQNRPMSSGQINGVSFIVLLPRAPGDLGALTKSLTVEQLSGWLRRLTTSTVMVYLPKFKLEERYQLANTLQSMGVSDAFKYGPADFSGMNGAKDLFISKVIHQTFVNVDEKGTEAAAATAVMMAAGSAGPRTPPPEFRADHPFLFLIRDDVSGSILFLGQLANPDPLHEDIPARGARINRAAGPRGTARGPARGTAAQSPVARPPAASGIAAPPPSAPASSTSQP